MKDIDFMGNTERDEWVGKGVPWIFWKDTVRVDLLPPLSNQVSFSTLCWCPLECNIRMIQFKNIKEDKQQLKDEA